MELLHVALILPTRPPHNRRIESSQGTMSDERLSTMY